MVTFDFKKVLTWNGKAILSQEGQKVFAKSLLKLNLKKKRRVKKCGNDCFFWVFFFYVEFLG